ncbi:hypothetical protein [Bradyrhizobium sp. WSM1417]|uniref:hypothetical protein n=1 Tax=Bradyrhizobium sp. WSM1417 TaxID=754500 RepID=UPI0004B92141|nr:hypothetical protein [Bradyrhizobium sp. WSM1417]
MRSRTDIAMIAPRESAHCTNTDSIDLICEVIMPVAQRDVAIKKMRENARVRVQSARA